LPSRILYTQGVKKISACFTNVIARSVQRAGVSRAIHGSSLLPIISSQPQQLVRPLELGKFNPSFYDYRTQ